MVLTGTVGDQSSIQKATFISSAILQEKTTYTVTLTDSITDQAGNALSATTWSFTTDDINAPTVSSKTPIAGKSNVAVNTSVTVTFSEAMNAISIEKSGSFTLKDADNNPVNGVVKYNGTNRQATFTPSNSLQGEMTYTVTLTDSITDQAGNALSATTWSFTTHTLSSSNGNFTDSGQSLGNSESRDVFLGDLDGDGDLDAFVANYSAGNKVWFNEGNGSFIDSGQTLGNSDSLGVFLGDLDGDSDLDAFVVNWNQGNGLWINDGNGTFTDSGQSLGSAASTDISLGDLDGDGDLDAFVTNSKGETTRTRQSTSQPNRVWINDGNGTFTDSGQSLGNVDSTGISLGDVDGDGDLDAFVTNDYQGVRNLPINPPANRLWINDGKGTFTDSQQSLGSTRSKDISLGDVDGDGDLDAFVVNLIQGGRNSEKYYRVWLNDGKGAFTDSRQFLGSVDSEDISLGDVDGDGDLDAFVTNKKGNRIWINNGKGQFSNSGESLGNANSYGISLGDVDGDGDLDAFVGNNGENRVWINN